MEQENIKKQIRNKYIKISLLACIALVIVAIISFGLTKAYMKPLEDTSSITEISLSSCASISLKSTGDSINLSNSYAMSKNRALQTTPYNISVVSTCEESSGYGIYLATLNTNTLDASNIHYILTQPGSKEIITEGTLTSAIDVTSDFEDFEITEYNAGLHGTLNNIYNLYEVNELTEETSSFDLYLFIDENATITEGESKTFSAGIAIKPADSIIPPYEFAYKSTVYNKTIEADGYYFLQVWGAQGGSYSASYSGGKGGYSQGYVYLYKGDTIYVWTGGQPSGYNTSATNGNTNSGGTNGGGTGRTYAYNGTTTYTLGGGGGTDIRVNGNTYYYRIIVAGGGSGSTNASSGYAGGGINGVGYSTGYYGTATTYGYNGSFGQGGSSTGSYNYKYGPPGGGGGWYGGASGSGTGSGNNYSDTDTTLRNKTGGGSGYVYTSATASQYPSGRLVNEKYQLYYNASNASDSRNAYTVAGNTSFLSPTGTSETGHTGNGYARITHVGKKLPAA